MAVQERDTARAKEIGAKVRKARAKARLSQEKVAQKAGISRETVRHIEAGDWIPGLDTLELLAQACDVSFVSLLPADLTVDSSGTRNPGSLKSQGRSLAGAAA